MCINGCVFAGYEWVRWEGMQQLFKASVPAEQGGLGEDILKSYIADLQYKSTNNFQKTFKLVFSDSCQKRHC